MRTFRAVYCNQHGIGEEEFERHLFWRSIPRKSLALTALIYLVYRGFFNHDFAAIRDIGNAHTTRQIRVEIEYFYAVNHARQSILRSWFHIRISGRRILRLAREVVPEDHPQHEGSLNRSHNPDLRRSGS